MSDHIMSLLDIMDAAAVAHGLACQTDTHDGYKRVYIPHRFGIKEDGDGIAIAASYDIRAFMSTYRHADEALRALLFDAAIPCCYCIDDKCTTLLMEEERTIEHNGLRKKLCGPYRHNLNIRVTPDNVAQCAQIMDLSLQYYKPQQGYDVNPDISGVSFNIAEKTSFWAAGYTYKHTMLSQTDDTFIHTLCSGDRRAELDKLSDMTGSQTYIGLTHNFIDGINYDFLFGLLLTEKPAALPDGAIALHVNGGTWAVYNDVYNNYPAIWRHFTERFWNAAQMGFDPARPFFESYDSNGSFSGVHIPVDANLPRDSGYTMRLIHTPDMTMAGYGNYAETDHPQYTDRPFDEHKALTEAFPHNEPLNRISIHAHHGKPLYGFDGYALAQGMDIPDGMETCHLIGGYERRFGYRHYSGGYQPWGECFGMPVNATVDIFDMQHPRGFNHYIFRSRGGYGEIGTPLRIIGKRQYTRISMEPIRVIGKREAPPSEWVTLQDKQRLLNLPLSTEPGCYYIACVYKTMVTTDTGFGMYDKMPPIFGAPAEAGQETPDGLAVYIIGGGAYMHVTEEGQNGEQGWEMWDVIKHTEKTGEVVDMDGTFMCKQFDYGKRYELFIPLKG